MSCLIAHDAFTTLMIKLHEVTTNREVTCIENHVKWLGVVRRISTGADARLFFTASNAARFSGRHDYVESFFKRDDIGCIEPAWSFVYLYK